MFSPGLLGGVDHSAAFHGRLARTKVPHGHQQWERENSRHDQNLRDTREEDVQERAAGSAAGGGGKKMDNESGSFPLCKSRLADATSDDSVVSRDVQDVRGHVTSSLSSENGAYDWTEEVFFWFVVQSAIGPSWVIGQPARPPELQLIQEEVLCLL